MNVTEVKSSIKISDLPRIRTRIRAYVSGKKSYTMNCPFHPDKNSSAGIFTHQKGYQMFKCFACDITDDVIGVYGRLHNLHYMEAATELSQDFPTADLKNKIKQTIYLKKYFNVDFYTGFQKLISTHKHKADKDGMIPLAFRYVSLKVLDRVSLSTVQRELSTLFCLGLLKKPPGKAKKGISRFALVELTSVRLNEAEKRAQRLKESGIVKKFIKDSNWIDALPKIKIQVTEAPEVKQTIQPVQQPKAITLSVTEPREEIENVFDIESLPEPETLTREIVLKRIEGKDRNDPFVVSLLNRFRLQLKREQESFRSKEVSFD